VFAAGYLLPWAAFGVLAYTPVEVVRSLDVGFLAWDRAGQRDQRGMRCCLHGERRSIMRSTSSFAAAEGQAAGSGWGVSPRRGRGWWKAASASATSTAGSNDSSERSSWTATVTWFVRGSQSSRTSIPFWVRGAIALLAPATTALILRRKRASEIDGAVPALEVGGVN
jgi:hypothetical protein